VVGSGEKSDGGGGDDAGGFDGGTAGGQPGGEGGGDPVGGLTSVLTDKDARRLTVFVAPEVMGDSEADGVDGGGIERGLTGDRADAVGSEELLHVSIISAIDMLR